MSMQDKIEIGIIRIADLGFGVNEKVQVSGEYKVNYGISISYNIEHQTVDILISPRYSQTDGSEPFVTGAILTIFLVKDLKNFIKDKKLAIPDIPMITMFSMAFTHARALFAKNCAGTIFRDSYLPIINPKEMLESTFPQLLVSVETKVEQKTKKKVTKHRGYKP